MRDRHPLDGGRVSFSTVVADCARRGAMGSARLAANGVIDVAITQESPHPDGEECKAGGSHQQGLQQEVRGGGHQAAEFSQERVGIY